MVKARSKLYEQNTFKVFYKLVGNNKNDFILIEIPNIIWCEKLINTNLWWLIF